MGLGQEAVAFISEAPPSELNVLTPDLASKIGISATFGSATEILLAAANNQSTSTTSHDNAADNPQENEIRFQEEVQKFAIEHPLLLDPNGPYIDAFDLHVRSITGNIRYNNLSPRQALEAAHARLRSQWGYSTDDPAHLVVVADMYFYGENVPQDSTRAFQVYRDAALLGDTNAEERLAYMLYNGIGTERNYEEAAQWYRSAAERGNVLAQRALSRFYLLSIGVPFSYSESFRWMRRAAEGGLAEARYLLGLMYRQEEFGVPNDTLSLFWISSAANDGEPRAMLEMARAFDYGDGVWQDSRQSVRWLFSHLDALEINLIDSTIEKLREFSRDTIRILQMELAQRQHYAGSIDGISGPVTEAAIRSYTAQRTLNNATRPSQ